jgi:formiminotetrahydrofolate cyclodeaminase
MKLRNMTVEELLAELASDAPAPGGGSGAALAGAMAASLCEMVSLLTMGRENQKDAWPAMENAGSEARRLGIALRRLIDEDTEAYNSVVAARRLPKTTPAEKTARESAVQLAVSLAARVPLETLQSIAELSAIALVVAERGSPGCITDAGTAGEMIAAGARAASWNVRVNLPGLRDIPARDRLAADAAAALAEVLETVGRIRAAVETHLTL